MAGNHELNGITDFREVLSKIKEFSKISGLQYNTNKTYAFQMSPLAAKINEYENIVFVDKIKLLGIWYGRNSSARTIKENWEGKIEQLERIFALWSKHRLSLIGKVLVVKVFGLSLFIYIMKSIGLPPSVLQRINRMFFAFIWKRNFKEGKTFERVKRKVMCMEMEEGGLQMIDIHSMQDCFMIKWCLKLIVEYKEKWAAIPKTYLEKVGNINVFLCDSNKDKFKGLFTIKSYFWKEALVTWLTHTGAETFMGVKELKFSELPIFNNPVILFEGQTLYHEEAIKRGVFLVKDILSEEGTMISLADYLSKYGLYPRAQIDYFMLINVLKKNLMTQQGELAVIQDKAKQVLNMQNKRLRKLIEDEYKEIPCGKKLWERKLNLDVSELYVSSLKCTKEVKIKELLFKIFHNIYPTNIMLQKIGIKNSNKCDFCQEVDFLEHFLINCVRLAPYWQQVLSYIEKETKVIVPDFMEHKLFGITDENSNGKNINKNIEKANLFLMIAKLSIIKAKFCKLDNIFSVFQSEINFRGTNH